MRQRYLIALGSNKRHHRHGRPEQVLAAAVLAASPDLVVVYDIAADSVVRVAGSSVDSGVAQPLSASGVAARAANRTARGPACRNKTPNKLRKPQKRSS